jgi:hypothetical protein
MGNKKIILDIKKEFARLILSIKNRVRKNLFWTSKIEFAKLNFE